MYEQLVVWWPYIATHLAVGALIASALIYRNYFVSKERKTIWMLCTLIGGIGLSVLFNILYRAPLVLLFPILTDEAWYSILAISSLQAFVGLWRNPPKLADMPEAIAKRNAPLWMLYVTRTSVSLGLGIVCGWAAVSYQSLALALILAWSPILAATALAATLMVLAQILVWIATIATHVLESYDSWQWKRQTRKWDRESKI